MTEHNQKQLGKTLWNIADQLRGAKNANTRIDKRDAPTRARRLFPASVAES